jgi:hypothetical protein
MKMFSTDLAEFRMNAADTVLKLLAGTWEIERNAAKIVVMKVIPYSFPSYFCYAIYPLFKI